MFRLQFTRKKKTSTTLLQNTKGQVRAHVNNSKEKKKVKRHKCLEVVITIICFVRCAVETKEPVADSDLSESSGSDLLVSSS